MRFYTVHVGPGDAEGQGTELVPEGFSWMAFLFPIFWLPLKGLWVQLAIMVALYVFLGFAETEGLLAPEVTLCITLAASLLAGLEGRNWQRHRLARLGFAEAGIVAGANLLDAETRWFATKPPVSAPAIKQASKQAAPIPSLLPWPGQTA
jgi:hypothetical protein